MTVFHDGSHFCPLQTNVKEKLFLSAYLYSTFYSSMNVSGIFGCRKEIEVKMTSLLVCCTLLWIQQVVAGLDYYDTSNYKIVTDPEGTDFNHFVAKCKGELRFKVFLQVLLTLIFDISTVKLWVNSPFSYWATWADQWFIKCWILFLRPWKWMGPSDPGECFRTACAGSWCQSV